MDELAYETEVDNGIKFLNQRVPGWAELVDLERLDLGAGDHCALAQADQSTFGQAIRRLAGMTSKSAEGRAWAVNHGFMLPGIEHFTLGASNKAYARLTATWRTKIAELLRGAP